MFLNWDTMKNRKTSAFLPLCTVVSLLSTSKLKDSHPSFSLPLNLWYTLMSYLCLFLWTASVYFLLRKDNVSERSLDVNQCGSGVWISKFASERELLSTYIHIFAQHIGKRVDGIHSEVTQRNTKELSELSNFIHGAKKNAKSTTLFHGNT